MKTTKHNRAAVPALLVVLAMLLCMLPLGVSAASVPDSGNTFTFTDSGVTASDADGGGFKIEGTALQINASGVYTLTGSCAEGSIAVKKGTTGVTLILDNLTLSCSTTAPLACNKETETTIYIVGDVTLRDSESLDNADSDDFEGAAIKVKSGGSLTITGSGTLNIDGACKNGIKGAAASTVAIEGGTINVSAANHGIASDNAVVINGGTISITAGNEGIKASPDADDADSLGDVTVNGGTITINADDDGIHAGRNLTINGGTVTVSAGDDGLKAEYDLTIDGGDVTVSKSYEGIEGATVNLVGGSARVTASDDGVNAANSDLSDYAFAINISGGSWYVDAGGDGLDSNGTITISGGVTEVYGSADNGNGALDSERGITCTGGTVLAIGMSGMAETPGSGTYVAFGASGMGGGMMGGFGGRRGGDFAGQMPEQGGFGDQQPGDFGGRRGGGFGAQAPEQGGFGDQQPGSFGGRQMGGNDPFGGADQQQGAGGISISAGSALVIQDSAGNTLYTATAVRNANSVIFVSDTLTEGETYTLYVDGSEAATATAAAGSGMGGNMGGMPGQPGGGPRGEMPGRPGGDPQPRIYNGHAVMRSLQNVTVNGAAVRPDVYNIDDSNYFKLRDLAALLSGTGAQFEVSYDEETKVISITTGAAYTPVGGELAVGADNAASCVESAQSIEIDGATVSLTAYNIGGYNYFMLRDLGKALGFGVSFDEASNTAVITS